MVPVADPAQPLRAADRVLLLVLRNYIMTQKWLLAARTKKHLIQIPVQLHQTLLSLNQLLKDYLDDLGH